MKALKIFGITVFSIVLFLYIAFLTIVPKIVDLNTFKTDIQKIVNDTTKLNIDFQNLRYSTTPTLAVTTEITDLSIDYPQGDNILKIKTTTSSIPLIPLLFGSFKVKEINIEKPEININIDQNGQYDFITYFSQNMPQNDNKSPKNDTKDNILEGLPIKFSKNMPNINVSNYILAINNNSTNQKSIIKGDYIKIKDFNLEKNIKISAVGFMTHNDKKYLNYDLNIATFIPNFANDKKIQNQTKEEMIFINPFKNIIEHNFTANIYSDIKITNNNKTNINGKLNIDKLSVKTKGVILPESHIYLDFKDNNVTINSNLYSAKDEKTDIFGKFNFGKKANINLNIKNKSVKIENLKNILLIILDVLNLENNINDIITEGYISADFGINTDFKNIKSNGQLLVKNAKIIHKKLPIKIDDIKATLDFENNKILLDKTSASINGSKIEILGSINNKAEADIKISTNKLPLNELYQAFAGQKLKNSYQVTSGVLTLNAYIKGQLDNIAPITDINLEKLIIADKQLNANYTLENVSSKFTLNDEKYNGNIQLKNLKAKLNDINLNLNIPSISVDINEKDIQIKNFPIYIDKSKLTFDAKIKDYLSNCSIDGVLKGQLNTSSLQSYLPKNLQPLTKSSGSLPTILTITSDIKNTNIKAQILANAQNYFSPIEINEMKYRESFVNFDSTLNDNNFNIKDIGIYTIKNNATISNDLKTNLTNATQLACINGKILNITSKEPTISNLKISTNNSLTTNIPTMLNSSATLHANFLADGALYTPIIKGTATIEQANIPLFGLKLNNLHLALDKDTISGNCQNININGSDISTTFNAKNNFSKDFIINSITINSKYLDLDKLLDAFAQLPQANYAPSTSIPVKILKGKGTINKFLMGTIEASNASSDFSMDKNILYLNNLNAIAYQGNIFGDLSYDLQYLILKAKLKGQSLNSNSAISAFIGLKDQINGFLDFNADISLRGANLIQQLQSLTGNATFNIKDGQMGNLGKLEYYLNAQNLISSKLFNINLNSIMKTISPKNTGKFSYLKGNLAFKNGYVYLSPVESSGPNMSLYLDGTFNLLNNFANIELLGRLSQEVHQSLGTIGDLSISKLLSKNNSKFTTITNNIIGTYNSQTNNQQLAKIPQLTPKTDNTQSFAVKINGNIESVSAVKSFKWLTTQNFVPTQNNQTQVPNQTNIGTTMQGIKNQFQQMGSTIKQNMQSTTYTPTTNNYYEKQNNSNISTQKNTATSQPKSIDMADFLKNLPDNFSN